MIVCISQNKDLQKIITARSGDRTLQHVPPHNYPQTKRVLGDLWNTIKKEASATQDKSRGWPRKKGQEAFNLCHSTLQISTAQQQEGAFGHEFLLWEKRRVGGLQQPSLSRSPKALTATVDHSSPLRFPAVYINMEHSCQSFPYPISPCPYGASTIMLSPSTEITVLIFFFSTKSHSFIWMYHILFIH